MVRGAFLASALVALGSPQSPQSSAVSVTVSSVEPSSTEPCGQIAAIQAEAPGSSIWKAAAELAYQCLQSVPVDQEGDSQLIEDLKLMLKWNSNTAWLKKDLPEWYDNPSIDLYGELDSIQSGLQDGKYKSEYDIQIAIFDLLSQTGDGHIYWKADIQAVFEFHKSVTLISVVGPEGGAPKVYGYDDIYLNHNSPQNFTPSAIEKINGIDVEEYLRKVGRQTNAHDAHARWNSLFFNQAGTSLTGNDFGGTWTVGKYDSGNTTYSFANGTARTFIEEAFFVEDFTGVKDGPTFFAKFCAPQPETSDRKRRAFDHRFSIHKAAPVALDARQASEQGHNKARGYPPALTLHSGKAIGGYYVEGNDDLAVLSIPTFGPEDKNASYEAQAAHEFQTVTREFLKQAASDNKKKLIIDLRFNPGGNVVLGFDLLRLLFPDTIPHQSTRRRAHEGFKQLADLAAYRYGILMAKPNITDDEKLEMDAFAEFSYYRAIKPDSTHFKSVEEFYGPHNLAGDEYTSLRGYNFSDTDGWSPNITLAGYGNPLAFQEPYWKPEDIVLLQDGYCGSTCSIVAETLRTSHGVETLFVGGLPKENIPAQKVGNTKGWLTWKYDSLTQFPQFFYLAANETTTEASNGTELHRMNQTTAFFNRVSSFAVNAADAIRKGDEDQTPLQFVYEAAECRLWYTIPMILDTTETWKAVANAKWGNGTCDAGKGFGTLEKEGDGGNQTEVEPGNPKVPENPSAAAGMRVPGFTVLLAILAALFLL